MLRRSFTPEGATPAAWHLARPSHPPAGGVRCKHWGGEACELLLAEVSCALLWASFGFPALLVRERQNRCDMVYVLARLFICHSLAIILDLQKILWYEGRLWAAASQLSRTDCPRWPRRMACLLPCTVYKHFGEELLGCFLLLYLV